MCETLDQASFCGAGSAAATTGAGSAAPGGTCDGPPITTGATGATTMTVPPSGSGTPGFARAGEARRRASEVAARRTLVMSSPRAAPVPAVESGAFLEGARGNCARIHDFGPALAIAGAGP